MSDKPTPKPDGYGDEHKEFLNDLRESGVTNMFGAAPFVQEEFELTKAQARSYLGYWMETFGS